jgi:hypothetical protein
VDGARTLADELRRAAHAALDGQPMRTGLLRALADFVVDRAS